MKHLNKLLLFSIITLFSFSVSTNLAYGLSQEQRDAFASGILYYDIEPPTILSSCGRPTVIAANNSLYMIGDSITEGSITQLNGTFTENNYSPTINGVSSRSLTEGAEEINGLGVLERDKTNYSEAGTIVIALGTNGGLTEASIKNTIDKIRANNESALLYWVNVGVNNDLRSGADLTNEAWNEVLENQSTEFKYSVIDWSSVVNENPDSIADDGLGVHPNERGKGLFATTIVDFIKSVNPLDGACSSTPLTGDTNAEKVWNYMIGRGLQPFQVAGFMGNMQAEAGFEPRRVEYPVRSSGDVWIDGRFPDSLSDTVPDCLGASCRPGYGIVQWTAESRKQGLRDIAAEQDMPEGDLGLQLDYVWREIAGTTFRGTASVRQEYFQKYGQNRPIIEALAETKTIEEATDLILNHYEIPANIPAASVKRIVFARNWLIQFGSGGI